MVLQFNVYDRSVKALEMEKNQKSGQNENEDEGGDQEESEEAVSEEEENEEDDDDDYDDGGIFEYSKAIPLGSYPEKGAFSKIVSVLKRKVTAVSALVIPCYFLYTSQTIVPEQLKNIDDMLFRTLVKEGFPVALVPVQLNTTTDYQGSYSSGERELLIRDFPFRVYQQNSVTEETTSKILKTVPSGFKFTYVFSGLEATYLLDSTCYSEFTGNKAQLGENQYLCCAMIVFKNLAK
jgi:hypothetical protein